MVESHPVSVAVSELRAWAFTDSRVMLDSAKLRDALHKDAEKNDRGMLTPDECELFICGDECSGAPPAALVSAFPSTHAYLEELLT